MSGILTCCRPLPPVVIGLSNMNWTQHACYVVKNMHENVEHFLLRCESLTKVRQFVLIKIRQSLQNSRYVGYFNKIRSNDTEFTAIVLNCTTMIDDANEPVLDTFLHAMKSTVMGSLLCSSLETYILQTEL